jgi:hypothetical protein
MGTEEWGQSQSVGQRVESQMSSHCCRLKPGADEIPESLAKTREVAIGE